MKQIEAKFFFKRGKKISEKNEFVKEEESTEQTKIYTDNSLSKERNVLYSHDFCKRTVMSRVLSRGRCGPVGSRFCHPSGSVLLRLLEQSLMHVLWRWVSENAFYQQLREHQQKESEAQDRSLKTCPASMFLDLSILAPPQKSSTSPAGLSGVLPCSF